MDLQDFDGEGLYFDNPMAPEVEALLAVAGEQYSEGTAEEFLLAAQTLAPENLTVLVGLYRFYYYQHRYQDALGVADRVLDIVGPQLSLPAQWCEVKQSHLNIAADRGMGLLRFYLLALKGAGYLNLRLNRFEQGKAMLTKVVELDSDNRLGARLLLDVLASHSAEILTFPTATTVEIRP
ncbi:hypothetical protein [Azomonas macrocytogenes]|uniref:Tetratricopeptide (TPR) repeat protein n=1 Tax=Azomonas macrocytogenes TaxID=69962 RepID=A0A839T610_AZOMA|nr:hypothetical protein [Azomonas macrocytogenes]MBB3103916.1 tetratricopeptide (TPR) repeat protein [Azomonas macrocytogenes]